MAHVLPTVNRVLLSTLRRVIESLLPLFSSAVNHPDHLLPFWRGELLLFLTIKGDYCNTSKWKCLTVPGEGGSNSLITSVICFILYCWNFYEEWIRISCQSTISLVNYIQYFVDLGHVQCCCQMHWSPLWVFTCHLISISYSPLNFDKASCPN